MNKKGLMGYTTMVLGFVILFIVAVAGLSVLVEMQGTFEDATTEYNATGDAISGIEKITGFAPLIGIVLAIGIVLGILFGVFGSRVSGGGAI